MAFLCQPYLVCEYPSICPGILAIKFCTRITDRHAACTYLSCCACMLPCLIICCVSVVEACAMNLNVYTLRAIIRVLSGLDHMLHMSSIMDHAVSHPVL